MTTCVTSTIAFRSDLEILFDSGDESIDEVLAKARDAFHPFTQREARITPLNQASTHVICEPERARKLLLNKKEIDRLIGGRERQGYSIVATAMYWKKCWVKLEIYLAKGKQEHDKRDAVKDRDWERQKARVMKHKA